MKPVRRPVAQAEARKKALTEATEAARNVAYWSIAVDIEPDGLVKALDDALAEATQILAIARTALDLVLATLDSVADALTETSGPLADIADTRALTAALGQQMRETIVESAFQGFNLLDGSRDAAPLRFVSGFDAGAKPGSFNTISFQTTAVYQDGAGLLVRDGVDLTDIEFASAESAAAAMREVKLASNDIAQYASRIKAALERMEAASGAESAQGEEPLDVSSEADEHAMRLRALETQKELGAHRLPIANQNSQFSLALPRSNGVQSGAPLVLKR